MNKEEEALNIYIEQLHQKISNLDQTNSMLNARIVILEKDNRKLQGIVDEYEKINKKKLNKVTGFSHKKTVKGR